jgi:hypothetical protein
MINTEHLFSNYFSPSEIRLMNAGANLPGTTRNLETLRFDRVANVVLEKVCELALQQSVEPHSTGRSCGFEDTEIASIDTNRTEAKSWNIHVDVIIPLGADRDETSFPISNPSEILGVEICWEPNTSLISGDLDDYRYDVHEFTREPYHAKSWIAKPLGNTPLWEVTSMLILLDEQLKRT